MAATPQPKTIPEAMEAKATKPLRAEAQLLSADDAPDDATAGSSRSSLAAQGSEAFQERLGPHLRNLKALTRR